MDLISQVARYSHTIEHLFYFFLRERYLLLSCTLHHQRAMKYVGLSEGNVTEQLNLFGLLVCR